MNRHLYLLMDAGNEMTASAEPLLLQLLALGRAEAVGLAGEALLARDFGVTSTAFAALSWLGEGHDPGTACWMYADPVHFALQRDYFALAYPAPLSLTADERATLLADLNRHFAQEGLHFHIAASGSWYLQTDRAAEMETALLQQAAGYDVREFQPQGPDAGYWKRIMNEIQMLLHEHPVNQAREARGELAVNSLWLSGQGRLPDKPQLRTYAAVYAQQPVARGLGALSAATVNDLPSLDAYLAASDDNSLLVLDSAQADCTEWLRALRDALRAGKLQHLTLSLVLRDRTLVARLKPLDVWKFWRRSKPLQSY